MIRLTARRYSSAASSCSVCPPQPPHLESLKMLRCLLHLACYSSMSSRIGGLCAIDTKRLQIEKRGLEVRQDTERERTDTANHARAEEPVTTAAGTSMVSTPARTRWRTYSARHVRPTHGLHPARCSSWDKARGRHSLVFLISLERTSSNTSEESYTTSTLADTCQCFAANATPSVTAERRATARSATPNTRAGRACQDTRVAAAGTAHNRTCYAECTTSNDHSSSSIAEPPKVLANAG